MATQHLQQRMERITHAMKKKNVLAIWHSTVVIHRFSTNNLKIYECFSGIYFSKVNQYTLRQMCMSQEFVIMTGKQNVFLFVMTEFTSDRIFGKYTCFSKHCIL